MEKEKNINLCWCLGYYDDKIQFEGEYIEGKRWNGNGYNINSKKEFEIKDGNWHIKEYDDSGELYFEEINGIGKEYDYSSNLIFERKYLKGEKIRKGKEYYDDGNLKNEGEYLNGKRNREGKEYDDKGIIKFEGKYLNEKSNGKWKEYDLKDWTN